MNRVGAFAYGRAFQKRNIVLLVGGEPCVRPVRVKTIGPLDQGCASNAGLKELKTQFGYPGFMKQKG